MEFFLKIFIFYFSYCFMIHKTFNENDQSEKVVFTHVLTKGLNKEENYGIIITSIMKNFLCCNKVIMNSVY